MYFTVDLLIWVDFTQILEFSRQNVSFRLKKIVFSLGCVFATFWDTKGDIWSWYQLDFRWGLKNWNNPVFLVQIPLICVIRLRSGLIWARRNETAYHRPPPGFLVYLKIMDLGIRNTYLRVLKRSWTVLGTVDMCFVAKTQSTNMILLMNLLIKHQHSQMLIRFCHAMVFILRYIFRDHENTKNDLRNEEISARR